MILTRTRRRGLFGLGQYDSAYSGYSNADPSLTNNPSPSLVPSDSIFSLPGGISYQNLASGTLSPSQVALLQSQGAAQVQQVYDNTVLNYGADSPAAQAVAAVLPTQIQGVYSDIAALNPQSTDPLLNATGIPWYIWALGAGVAIWALSK